MTLGWYVHLELYKVMLTKQNITRTNKQNLNMTTLPWFHFKPRLHYFSFHSHVVCSRPTTGHVIYVGANSLTYIKCFVFPWTDYKGWSITMCYIDDQTTVVYYKACWNSYMYNNTCNTFTWNNKTKTVLSVCLYIIL